MSPITAPGSNTAGTSGVAGTGTSNIERQYIASIEGARKKVDGVWVYNFETLEKAYLNAANKKLFLNLLWQDTQKCKEGSFTTKIPGLKLDSRTLFASFLGWLEFERKVDLPQEYKARKLPGMSHENPQTWQRHFPILNRHPQTGGPQVSSAPTLADKIDDWLVSDIGRREMAQFVWFVKQYEKVDPKLEGRLATLKRKQSELESQIRTVQNRINNRPNPEMFTPGELTSTSNEILPLQRELESIQAEIEAINTVRQNSVIIMQQLFNSAYRHQMWNPVLSSTSPYVWRSGSLMLAVVGVSIAADFVPIVGDLKCGLELSVGQDLWGKMSGGERQFGVFLFLVSVAPGGDLIRYGARARRAGRQTANLNDVRSAGRVLDDTAASLYNSNRVFTIGSRQYRVGTMWGGRGRITGNRINVSMKGILKEGTGSNHQLLGDMYGMHGATELADGVFSYSIRLDPDGTLTVSIIANAATRERLLSNPQLSLQFMDDLLRGTDPAMANWGKKKILVGGREIPNPASPSVPPPSRVPSQPPGAVYDLSEYMQ